MLLLKVGGGRDINWDYIARDITTLKQQLVIIHGANAKMEEITQKLGIAQKTITSPSGHTSRYTDKQTLDALLMVYSGLTNKQIVSTLIGHGVNAIGLTGADGKLWQGKRKDAILSVEDGKTKLIRDSFTGKVEAVNGALITLLTDNGYVPVITIPAITANGELINVDNDRAAAVMVHDVHIDSVVMLFEAPGLLETFSDEGSLVKEIKKEEIDIWIERTEGRMKKKLLGVKETIKNGAQKIYLSDGRIENPVSKALAGEGTVIS